MVYRRTTLLLLVTQLKLACKYVTKWFI